MPPRAPKLTAHTIALVGLIALAIAFFFPALLKINSVVVGQASCDAPSMFYPLRDFANRELQGGRLPLWNPYVFCGHPFHAEGQGAVFYPVNLLLAWLPPAAAMNVFALLHFIGAGLFFYLWLREMGLGVFAAWFGAAVYMLCSGPISRFYAGHYTIIPFLALAPAALYLWETWRRRGGGAPLVALTLAYGGMALAGYPQLLLYFSMYFGFHVLFDVAKGARKGSAKAAAFPVAAVAGVVVAGALLAAVQLFPSYDFARYSFRQEASFEFAGSFSFAPENFLTLLAPTFFGPLDPTGPSVADLYWGRNYLWEMWIYIGILPLALAALAMARIRSRAAVAHTIAVFVFLLLALGRHTPLFALCYRVIPFFRFFRGSSKFLFFAQISLCALAAMGAARLLRPLDERSARGDRRLVLAFLIAMFAVGVLLLLRYGVYPSGPDSPWRRLIAWRFAQDENYLYPKGRFPDPAAAWVCAGWSLARLLLLAGAGAAVVFLWPRIPKRRYGMETALAILAIPELWAFSHGAFRTTPTAAVAIPAPLVAPVRQAQDAPARVLATIFQSNAFSIARVETIRGYAGNITARYNDFLTVVEKASRDMSMVTAPLGRSIPAALLRPNVGFLLTLRPASPPAGVQEVASMGQAVLYRYDKAAPRAAFSASWRIVPDAMIAPDAVEKDADALLQTDWVESSDPAPFEGLAPPVESDRIEWRERWASHIACSTSAAGPRLLVLSDSYDPNWRCRIDGRATPIYPANIAFRAVVVPAGEHRVEFDYAPRSFYIGLGVSLVVLLAALGFFAVFRFRPKLQSEAAIAEDEGRVAKPKRAKHKRGS
ncbi:MAG: YfhO family protein [Candidatus Sumerlaeota bacterium]|nr:YfhO family protein [Candidatus Sumerlaeota bacterium]